MQNYIVRVYRARPEDMDSVGGNCITTPVNGSIATISRVDYSVSGEWDVFRGLIDSPTDLIVNSCTIHTDSPGITGELIVTAYGEGVVPIPHPSGSSFPG